LSIGCGSAPASFSANKTTCGKQVGCMAYHRLIDLSQ